MKKLLAILLIGILFFNWYGYRLLTNYWQQEADRRLEARLNHNDYDESALISIKLPITSLSYANPSTTFQRIDGEIIVGDVAYKYVKRRIINDSLELLCIRDTEAMELDKAGNEFFGKVNNFPNSKPTPQKDFQKLFSPENFDAKITIPEPVEIPKQPLLTPSLTIGHPHRTERPPAAA